MPNHTFQISGLRFTLDWPEEIALTPGFRPFEAPAGEGDIHIQFLARPALDFPAGPAIYSDIAYRIYREGGGFCRVYHDHRAEDRPYAIGRTAPDGSSGRVEYLADSREFVSESQNSFFHIALEELLLRRDRTILHASLITSPWGGLLFSGPSGMGKSTQADLWARHMGSRIINGDRTILCPSGGGWTAWGSPYAGSSGYYVNEGLPVRGIVTLGQGPENRLERLTSGAAFRRLFAQMTVNSWNPWFVSRVLDLTAALTAAVPVYQLTCTPDIRAVETLRAGLEGD